MIVGASSYSSSDIEFCNTTSSWWTLRSSTSSSGRSAPDSLSGSCDVPSGISRSETRSSVEPLLSLSSAGSASCEKSSAFLKNCSGSAANVLSSVSSASGLGSCMSEAVAV